MGSDKMRVLVCGAGVIGVSIAYFLSRRGVEVTVIECTAVACAASGKSGGFLALDWCDGGPLEALARRSFELHAKLAQEIDDAWGYRRLNTYSGYAKAESAGRRRNAGDLDWISSSVRLDRRLGSTETTAQVHPGVFTTSLMRAAEARGANLHIGQVTNLIRETDSDRVIGVEVEGERMEGDAVVIAMGPWSILASRWLPLPGVYGLKGHSLVFKTEAKVSPDALFLDYREAGGASLAPEIFPRDDGTTYVCGLSGESPLPIDPVDVAPDPGALDRLRRMCAHLSPVLAEAPIVTGQACYRPVTHDGLPIIGAIPGSRGAYVATGHSVWGILNAPATGEAMAELIVDGAARTVDLSHFDPGRLRPFDPAQLRSLD
jgi:glycine/D-amino acid oxidase-like deaminating enzyme